MEEFVGAKLFAGAQRGQPTAVVTLFGFEELDAFGTHLNRLARTIDCAAENSEGLNLFLLEHLGHGK